MLLALLVFDGPDFPDQLGRVSPWLDADFTPLDEVLARLEAQRHRRFIKTHVPLDGLPLDQRVTYVVVGRDPRDIRISMGEHWDNTDRERALGFEHDDARIRELAAHSDFTRMRARAADLAPEVGTWRAPADFLRSRRMDAWAAVCTPEELQAYDDRVLALHPDREFLEWAHGGRGGPSLRV